MAIYNGRILMRKGNEADFDAEKLMAGEWAVSLDAGIVRICLEAGRVIRMATYEAFEEDMKQIEAILLSCETIEEAVEKINTDVSAKAKACEEYVEQAKAHEDEAKKYRDDAKTYSDEAKKYRDDAEQFKKDIESSGGVNIATNEKAGIVKPDAETLEIDEDGTLRVIGGGVSDYTELENKPSINGVELDGDKTFEELGFEGTTDYSVLENKPQINNVELNGNKSLEDFGIASAEAVSDINEELSKVDITKTASGEEINLNDSAEGKVVEFTLYGKATQEETPTTQKITEIKKIGISNNILQPPQQHTTETLTGITWDIYNGVITANGTATATFPINVSAGVLQLEAGKHMIKGCPIGGSDTSYYMTFILKNDTGNVIEKRDIGEGIEVDVTQEWADTCKVYLKVAIYNDYTAENVVFVPEIRRVEEIEITSRCEELQKEDVCKIAIKNGLAGIKVSNGGNYTDQNGEEWICDELIKYTEGSRELIQRIGLETLGNYDYTASIYEGDVYKFVSTEPLSNVALNNAFNLMCEMFTASDSCENDTICITDEGYITCFTSSYTTEEEFKTAMMRVRVAYELAEPITTKIESEAIANISTFYPSTDILNDCNCGMRIDYVSEAIITTNTKIPIVSQKEYEEAKNGDNVVVLFNKMNKKLTNIPKFEFATVEPTEVAENTIVFVYEE